MAQIETIMNEVKAQISNARTLLNKAYIQLESIEDQITNLDFNKILTDLEVEINNSKEGLCASFEAKFADDIANINATIQARKNTLEGKINTEE